VPELITALDVESKTFSRALRGYDPDQVDDFLDQIVETLRLMAEKTTDLERDIQRLEDQLKDYNNLKDTLQETLLMAQRSAEVKTEAAKQEADAIISEARAKGERIVFEAMNQRDAFRRDALRLQEMKRTFKSDMAALLSKYTSMLETLHEEETLEESQPE
jgi:cell division initiation protein